jgi:lipopolysaccharide export system permease protein
VKIIDRYITTEFMKVFAICVMGFVLVLLLVEITDKIKYYFQYNPPGWLMLKYFLVKIPGYMFYAIPLGILMGGMMSLLLMARHSEIIAMQANGIDALDVARPVLVVGMVASLVMLLANETVIPWSNRYSEHIQDVEIAKKADAALFKSDEIWVRSPGSITHVGKFDKASLTLERLTIVSWSEGYVFSQRVYADKARWSRDRWVLYGVNRTVATAGGRFHVESVPTLTGELDRRPDDFVRLERPASEMNLVQLGAYIDRLEDEGQVPTRYMVDWHDKLAFPFACLIMSALSVPFAVKVNPRGGGVAVGLAMSLVVAFGYWIVHALFVAIGHGGYIPPVAAAWGTNVIFGLTATMLLLHSDT